MMTKDEFYNWLKETDLEVTFTKVTDGSIRVMKCTAQGPESGIGESEITTPSETGALATVFDIEAKGWRSFYIDKVISIRPIPRQSVGAI